MTTTEPLERQASDHETLNRLRQASEDDGRRILIRGGTILSMDPDVGDMLRGDILIYGKKIEAIAEDLGEAAGDGQAVVVDAEDMVVIPGFHDTHRHCWQGQFRRLLPGADLNEYIEAMHYTFAPKYRPEDVYAASLISALGAIDTGVTCLLDFFHNTRSSAHSDASIQAFNETGIRAVHASGPPLVGEWEKQWPQDLVRLREQYFSSDDQLVTLRLAVFALLDLGGPSVALTPENLAFARGLGLEISADAAFGPSASENVEELGKAGLLGPDITLIHGTDMTDAAWQMVADAGVAVSLCPTSDPQIGCFGSVPPVQKALDFGVRPGLSVDVECCLSTDMFVQMQAIYTIQRMAVFNQRFLQDPNAPEPISARHVLQMATVDGATVNGLAHKVGTLTPGKEADIVFISAGDVNTLPLNNAVGTVVLGADTRNVDSVFIAGSARKWRGALVEADLAAVRRLVYESRDYLVAETGYALDVMK